MASLDMFPDSAIDYIIQHKDEQLKIDAEARRKGEANEPTNHSEEG